MLELSTAWVDSMDGKANACDERTEMMREMYLKCIASCLMYF